MKSVEEILKANGINAERAFYHFPRNSANTCYAFIAETPSPIYNKGVEYLPRNDVIACYMINRLNDTVLSLGADYVISDRREELTWDLLNVILKIDCGKQSE